MKIAFYTLGCKVNQYESNWLSEKMTENGYTVVNYNENADIYVINSCTVTAESDRKTRQAVRKFKRNHPDSIIVLTGCMPQAFPEDAEALKEADIVTGNKSNAQISKLIDEYFLKRERIVEISEHKTGDKFSDCIINKFEGRTRAIVKIEDGCNRFCSYCVIPYSRGRVRSKPIEELEEELTHLKNNGFCEIVLVGINLSAYGQDCGKNICDAVELACAKGFERVRLGSLEPDHITDEVIKRLGGLENFCPQFHISLQSGCDKTLKDMNRHYTSAEYFQLCEKLRSSFKDTTITTDIMTGFPGETDEDFKTTCDFALKVGFEKVHVFPYSPREGTKAAKLEQLPKSVKEARARQLIGITDEIREKYLETQVGRTVSVLFETRSKDGYSEGYTMNYTPVKVLGEIPCNRILDVKITGTNNGFCVGEII